MERTVNEPSDTHDLRILLIGKTGSGVSASGNTILGENVFPSSRSLTSITDRCQKHTAEVSNRRITVLDTPNFFNSSDIDLSVELKRGLNMCSPGIHAILLVLPLHTFTQQDVDTLFLFKQMFGQKAMKHTLVLFTHGDELQNKSLDQLIRRNAELSKLTEECGGRFHLLDNKDLNNRDQVNKLLMKIQRMLGVMCGCAAGAISGYFVGPAGLSATVLGGIEGAVVAYTTIMNHCRYLSRMCRVEEQ